MAITDFKQKAGAYLTTTPPNIPQSINESNTEEEQGGFWEALAKPAIELTKDVLYYTPSFKNARASLDNLRAIDPQKADEIEKMIMPPIERPTVKKWVGDVTGTALTVLPLPIAKLGMISKIGSPFLRSAITGGGYVAAFNAADAAGDNESAGEIAKSAGLGFLAGGALGGAGYLGVRGFTRLASLKPVQKLMTTIGESESVKTITQYVRPVASVLSKDFGEVGRDVVNRLFNADRNVMISMGRIMRIMDGTGAKFASDDVGREASYQLGKVLRGRAAQRVEASQFTVAGSTFRSAEAENLSKEVFALSQEGKFAEAAQKSTQVADKELGAGLKNLGIRQKGTIPTIGVYEGGKEPSFLQTHFGSLDDKALGEIAAFGQKTNQDSLLVYQTKVGGNLITKADAQAAPALKMSVPGLNEGNVDDFRAAISEATNGKLGGYLTGDLSKGEVVLLNVQDFDGLTRQEFEALASEVRKVVQLNGGTVKTFYTRNTILTKENYGNYIQKAVGGERAGAAATGTNLPARGRITGRISEGEGRVLSDADAQAAFFGGELSDDIKSLSPEQFYRALFGDIASEAQSRGVQIRIPARKGEPARWVKFEPLENYFPQQVADIKEMKAGGRLRKWVLRRSIEEGDFKNEAEAIRALDGYIEYVEKEGIGVSKQNGWIEYMIKSGQAETPSEANRIMRAVFQEKSLVKMGGSIEHARIVNNPFYNPFPDEVAPLYAMDSLTRFENIAQFGAQYKGETVKLPELTRAIDEIRETQGRKAAEKFDKFLNVAMNRINTATDEAKFSYYLRMLQVPKLSFAQIINVGQSVLNPLLSTDARATFIGLRQAFTNQGVKRAMESGATIQSVFNEMVRATAAGGNFADKFLKVTGFIWTEKFNRTVAANAGIEWASRNFERLLKNPASAVYRTRISELGINVEKALARGKLTDNELLRAGQVLAEKTQFRSRPLDLPIWASSNAGKLFWQFKNFMYNQFIFVFRDNLIKEVKAGNYGRAARNLLLLGTIFPMTGEVLQDIRSLITQSRRPTGAFERYLSDISSVGAMALVSDLLDSARFDRTDEFFMPPALSSIVQIMNKADQPDELLKELVKQTGVGVPITNVMRERRRGRASTLESIQDVLGR